MALSMSMEHLVLEPDHVTEQRGIEMFEGIFKDLGAAFHSIVVEYLPLDTEPEERRGLQVLPLLVDTLEGFPEYIGVMNPPQACLAALFPKFGEAALVLRRLEQKGGITTRRYVFWASEGCSWAVKMKETMTWGRQYVKINGLNAELKGLANLDTEILYPEHEDQTWLKNRCEQLGRLLENFLEISRADL